MHRSHPARWLFYLTVLCYLAPTPAIARDTVRVCNASESRHMNIAVANNYWRGGQELWKESGWFLVGPNTCEDISRIRPFHAVGYAFQVVDGENVYNPFVAYKNFTAQKAPRMCAHRDTEFAYARKLAAQVGRECPEGAYSAIVSLFITGGNKYDTTTLHLNADNYLQPNNRVAATDVMSAEAVEKNHKRRTRVSVGKAAKRYLQSCTDGRANACYVAGNLYFKGNGVPQDFERAHELFRQGCESGSANACYWAGVLFSDDRGQTQDDMLAQESFAQACDLGLTKGCTALTHR